MMRLGTVSTSTGIVLLIGAGAIVVAGAAIAASRRLDDETVARRIDRASGLSDRLSTAIAFRRVFATGAPLGEEHATTEDLMKAAIADGLAAVKRAKVKLAAPFVAPRDWRAALGFLAISALAAGLALPNVTRIPRLFSLSNDHVRRGDELVIRGENLLVGVSSPLAQARTLSSVIGSPQVPADATSAGHGFVPTNANVFLGPTDHARPVIVLDWKADTIRVRIPDDAPFGETVISAYIDNQQVGPLGLTIVRTDDQNYFQAGALLLDPEDRQLAEDVLNKLRQIAKQDGIEDLDKLTKDVEQILADAEEGKITKQQALEKLDKLRQDMEKNQDPDPKELEKDLKELGEQLKQNPMTEKLGDALKNNKLDEAKKEFEKLADKLDKKELTDKQKDDLGKQLDKVAKQMEKKDQDKQDKVDKQEQKLEEEIRRLEKQKQEAKNDKERLDAERRLEQKKDELKKLQKEEDDKNKSDERQALKRLQRDMEKAAENLQKQPQQNQQDKDEQEQRDQQASQKLKDAARETGKVDQDQRKQAAQKKTSSQMDDLREAMQRAKQKGNKGPQDPFNRQGKQQDFIARARGQKGNGQSWKPGQGQQPGQGTQPGQGQDQPGGQGQDPGGKRWGTGHDDNLTGDATKKSGNQKDQELTGNPGGNGSSTRETILAAAQKGFASTAYKKVYAKYDQRAEDVMRNEKLPSSYKYYVKRYFAKIHPSMGDDAGDAAPAPKDHP
jgi:hypothetical protein